jgi:hypothetical protein
MKVHAECFVTLFIGTPHSIHAFLNNDLEKLAEQSVLL